MFFWREGMADKNRFANELTEEEVTTLVENATSKSRLAGSFVLNRLLIFYQGALDIK